MSSKASTTWVGAARPARGRRAVHGRSERCATALRLLQPVREPAAASRASASAPNRLLVPTSMIGHRRDLADQAMRRHDLHRLQIGRAADDLAGIAAGLLEQHVEGRADAARHERGLLPLDRRPAGAAAARPSRLPAIDPPCRRPACPGRGEYLNEIGAGVADLATSAQRVARNRPRSRRGSRR